MYRTKDDLLKGISSRVVYSKRIFCNTLKIIYDDGKKAIRYHHTDVVSFNKEETKITLNNGDFYTNTTRKRINNILNPLGVCIYQKNWNWYLQILNKSFPFDNGMILPNKRINQIISLNKLSNQLNNDGIIIVDENMKCE